MNNALLYLNTILNSYQDFDNSIKTDADNPYEDLAEKISIQLTIIEKDSVKLNGPIRSVLIDHLENLIKKSEKLTGEYAQKRNYYEFEVYHTIEYFDLSLVDNPKANKEHRKQMIKTCEAERLEKIAVYNKKREIIALTKESLSEIKKKLTLEQMKIPEIEQANNLRSTLIWKKSDTDLLELITALVETGTIQNPTNNITRKEAIEAFSQFFNIQIKDAESKLTRATNRKKDVAQFLESLKSSFEKYAEGKESRLDTQRR